MRVALICVLVLCVLAAISPSTARTRAHKAEMIAGGDIISGSTASRHRVKRPNGRYLGGSGRQSRFVFRPHQSYRNVHRESWRDHFAWAEDRSWNRRKFRGRHHSARHHHTWQYRRAWQSRHDRWHRHAWRYEDWRYGRRWQHRRDRWQPFIWIGHDHWRPAPWQFADSFGQVQPRRKRKAARRHVVSRRHVAIRRDIAATQREAGPPGPQGFKAQPVRKVRRRSRTCGSAGSLRTARTRWSARASRTARTSGPARAVRSARPRRTARSARRTRRSECSSAHHVADPPCQSGLRERQRLRRHLQRWRVRHQCIMPQEDSRHAHGRAECLVWRGQPGKHDRLLRTVAQ